MAIRIESGDCLEVMPTLGVLVDSVVTDPPYHLTSIVKRFGKPDSAAVKVPENGTGVYARGSKGFMGKQWDGGDVAFQPETWAAVMAVMKPGAHLLAFGGTRTYARMAVAIEDAGFEVRDTLAFLHGVGFPKSHNVSAKIDRCQCDVPIEDVSHLRATVDAKDSLSDGAEQDVFTEMCGSGPAQDKARATKGDPLNPMRDLREDDSPPAVEVETSGASILQQFVQEQDVCAEIAGAGKTSCSSSQAREPDIGGVARPGQSGMEGRGDVSKTAWELRECPLQTMPARSSGNGTERRIRDGASVGDGSDGGAAADSDRMCPPQGSRPSEQRPDELRTLAGQPQPQDGGAWPLCGGCGKPRVPDGLGTALKPAMELICMARKPLSESTVAKNVLEHGTGALNVDGCRIATADGYTENAVTQGLNTAKTSYEHRRERRTFEPSQAGRWPANLAHDGSEEVLAGFPTVDSPASYRRGPASGNKLTYGAGIGDPAGEISNNFGDSGSAARFFYTAKASPSEREGSKHPTVKPLDLMRWLVRLITPPGGTILDPFAGSGTTGVAAVCEGFDAILIEREPEYLKDIERRTLAAQGEPQGTEEEPGLFV